MTKLFNFIIFLTIVYLFFNISVSQFEKFTEIQKRFAISNDSINVPYNLPKKILYNGEIIDENESSRDDKKDIINTQFNSGSWDDTPKLNERKEAIVEDDHYDQEKIVNTEDNDTEINISDIISDIEGRSISENSCGYELSATKSNAEIICDSHTINNLKLNKPTSDILNELNKESSDGLPKTIKDIYNKIVTLEKGSTDNIKTQGKHTMYTDSNKYTTLKGQEPIVTQLTKSLHANDPNYDSYSIF